MTTPLAWLRHYDRSLLGRDLLGGVTAGTVVVPQAMAYATIAQLPVQVGLYTCMVPMVTYALLGGSRTLSVSTTSTVAALTATSLLAAGVAVDSNGSPGALATLTILVGLILLVARLLKLGGIIDNINDATLTGIKIGVGATVAVGQLPKVLGFDAGSTGSGFFPEAAAVLGRLGLTNPVTAVFSLVTLAVLVLLGRFAPRVPGPLVVVVGGIVAVGLFGLDRQGLALVDRVPTGLPTPVLPSLGDVGGLLPGAFAIAVMVFLETAAVGATVRRSGEPEIDNNAELVAIGTANLLGGFLRAMPAAGGFSQTAINQRAGARTQLSELVTAALALACALFLGGVLSLLPQATLACLVLVAVAGLLAPAPMVRLWRIGRVEFWVAAVTAAFGLTLGMLAAVLTGVVLTLFLVLLELDRVSLVELQPTPDGDVQIAGPRTRPEPGLLILRPDSQLYTANVQRVGREVAARVAARDDVSVVVLDVSALAWISVMVLDRLAELSHELATRDVELWLAELEPKALAAVQRTPRWAELEAAGRFQVTTRTALRAFREQDLA